VLNAVGEGKLLV